VSAAAHQHVDEPVDLTEEMSEADLRIIERAHEICGHPAAVEVLSNAQHVALLPPGNSELSNREHIHVLPPCLIPYATKILRAQIRAGELVAEMQARGELSDLIADDEPTTDAVDPPAVDWQQIAQAAWHDEGWKDAAVEYQVNRRNAYAWVRQ
jgi:hypothetical protein